MSDFSVKGINHVGLAPKDPEKAKWFFETALGMPSLGAEYVAPQKTHTIMFSSDARQQGFPTRMEILAPDEDPNGPIAKFLEKKGSGIHHVAINVDDVDRALAKLKSLNVELIDETPRPGAHNTRIAFVHPRATGGLLVELVQEQG